MSTVLCKIWLSVSLGAAVTTVDSIGPWALYKLDGCFCYAIYEASLLACSGESAVIYANITLKYLPTINVISMERLFSFFVWTCLYLSVDGRPHPTSTSTSQKSRPSRMLGRRVRFLNLLNT